MRGKRAKALKEIARKKSLDGSVIRNVEYKRLKKLHVHPHYAPVVVWYPSIPGKLFTGEFVKLRGVKYPFTDHANKRNISGKKKRQKTVANRSPIRPTS